MFFDFLKKRKHRKEVKLICFDLDNTLYDFGSAEAEAEAHLAEIIHRDIFAKKKNHSLKAVDILRIFNEIKKSHMHYDTEPEKFSRALWFRETLDRLNLRLKSADLKKYSLRYEKEYWGHLLPRIRLFPNTVATLESLKASGKYRLATITDSDGRKDLKINRIKAVGLDKYFDYIITTDDTGKNKPAIENFEHLLKMSGLDAEGCVMVGDHPEVDLINAKRAGLVTVWTKEHLNNDMHHNYVDYEIDEIGKLLDVLKKIERRR